MIETKSLTKEETNLYFKYLKEGKIEYSDKIIIGNYRLVIHFALKYTNSEFELDDLVSIGVIGLIKAVDSFDITKSITFSSYASRCINNEILMIFRHKRNWISLNDPCLLLKEVQKITLEERLSDDIDLENEVIEKVIFNNNMETLTKIMPLLDSRRREILLDYYGIGCTPLTQQQLADKYHISRSFISKTLAKTLKEIEGWMTFDEEVNSLQKLLTKNKKNNKIDM